MSVSLTRILANAGIPVAMNALVPGSGMADMFVRNAGTGLARGLVNSPSGPQRVGGRGSPEGAMPTRKFGSTRETAGELRSGFMDWLRDPLEAKKEKKEQARDAALAVRLGITGGEYSLIHRPAMSLIKKRTGDIQTNIMILQFRVQQFMARNLSAIASTLGVPKTKLDHEQPDPSKSWFGNLLTSLHKDLQQNPIFSTLESIGKHALNIGRILNPFTMGARAGNAAKSFGEFMQKLALGKEGYEFMKDPTKVYEKAGVKQDFQTKSVNLMKVNNEYQKLQLNMLYNVVGIGEELLGVLGVQYKRKRIDITHDEYSGTLKTHAEAARSQRMRDKKVETIQKIASRQGLGRLSPIYSTIKTGFQKAQSALNKNEANSRDRYVLAQMFENNDLENFRGLTPALTRFIDSLPEDIDFTDERNQALADQFKKLLNEALSTQQQDKAKESKRRRLVNSRSQARSAETYNTMFDTSQDWATAVANLFSSLTGKQAVNMRKREHIHKLRAFEKYQDFNMALTENGGFLEALINAGYDENVVRQIARSLGGPAEGIRQQFQRGSVSRNLEENLRRTPRETPINEIMGYDKTNPFYRPGGLRGFALTELENAAQKDLEALTYQTNLVELEDGVIKKLKKPTYNMSVYNFTKDAVDQLEKINYNAKIIDIDDASIDKIKKAEYSVRLVGIGGNVVQDAQPLFTSFFAGLRGVADYLVTLIFDRMPLRGSQRTPIEVHQIAANGGIFTGSDISELENQIITQPTLFQYDDIHQFAKGGTVAGQGRNTPAGRAVRWGASGRGKRRGLVGEGKKDNKKYNPEAIMPLAEDKDGNLGVKNTEKKKAIDENDNTKTAAEREKDLKEKQEKKEEEKKEEQQQQNEDEKKSLLQRISDLLDPQSNLNKLRAKLKQKKEEGGFGFKLPFDISSWISKLGIGMIGTALYKALPEGLFTGEDGIFSKLWKFTKDSIVSIFEKAKEYISEHAFDWFKGAWDHFHEHPLLDAGILMTIFPGTVGKLLVKVGGKALANPAAIPAMLGIGGMVYNLVDAFTKSKDETGEFSLGKFLNEFFLGSGGGVVGTLSKAASWGWMGAKIGAAFGGVGALPGMLAGVALGALVGSTDSRDEQGNFSWGKFFKNLAVGNDAAGGLENGGKQFLKWGLVGSVVGGPVGFFVGGAVGGLLGLIGADGFKKLYEMGEKSGQTVCKFFNWEKGSFAYKAATCGAANSIPWLGAFVFGALGSILDLGSLLIKGLWGWVKSFLPQSVIDKIEGNQSEYEKKFNEQNKNVVSFKEKDFNQAGGEVEYEHKMNVNDKDAKYINEAKTENEKAKRYREIEARNNRKIHWGNEATKGVNGKKYNPEKYIALKEKWAEEDKKINEIYSQEIDVPWTAPDIKDFNTTPDNAKQYKDLYDINPEDALKFAKGVFDKQEEERKKREAERESALKKIEAGSSPDDLRMDAQRKASSVPAAMAAKIGVGSDDDDFDMDDDMGSNIDVSNLQEATSAGMKDWVNQMKPKADDPIYKQQANVNKYNADMNANPDLGAMYAGTPQQADMTGPQLPKPSSAPAAAKAGEDASKKKESKQSPTASATPATPVASPDSGTPAAPAAASPDASGSQAPPGELNWIEKLISNTIQGAFKFGGSVVDAAKTAYNTGQQMLNGGGGAGSGAPFTGGNRAPGIGGRYGAIAGKRDELVLPLNQRAKGPNGKPMEWSQATNNPGNVGNTDQGGTYIFPDLQSGIKAQRDLLKERYSGGLTLRQMAMRYTPTMWHEALPTWSSKSGIGTEEVPNLNDPAVMARLLKAIHIAEGSSKWVPPEEVDYALGLKPIPADYKPKDYRQLTEKGKAYVAGGGASDSGVSAGPIPNASPAVQKYLAIMERNTHGARYELSARRESENPKIFDCSSFVSRSLREAGHSIPKPSPTTEFLGDALENIGFKKYPLRISAGLKQAPSQLQPGDILLNPGHHVETYWGNNKIIGAHASRPKGRENEEVSIKEFYSTGYPAFYRLVSGAGGYYPSDLIRTGEISKGNSVYSGYLNSGASLQDMNITPSTKLSWPADSGVVTSGMGHRNPGDFVGAKGNISSEHGGTDIHAPLGSPIYSAMSGTVVGTSPDYGTVEIQHPDGWRSKYLHMGKFTVKAGQKVNAGDMVGESGGTGKGGRDVYTPHLHFEMMKDGVKVDPEKVFAGYKGKTTISKDQALENASKRGVGGPEFTPKINKQMSEYLSSRNEETKKDNSVVAELKKLQSIMLAVLKVSGKPAIAVAPASPSGNENANSQNDITGGVDAAAESMFSQIGGLLPNLNVSLTGLGTSIA